MNLSLAPSRQEGVAGSPPFQGELMLIGYFGLTLLHTPPKKKGATSEYVDKGLSISTGFSSQGYFRQSLQQCQNALFLESLEPLTEGESIESKTIP